MNDGKAAFHDHHLSRNAASSIFTQMPGSDQVLQSKLDRIVLAVAQAAHDRGLVGLTASEIISAAGISRATFYVHFENRDECLDFAIEAACNYLVAAVKPATGEAMSRVDRFGAGLAGLVRSATAKPLIAELCLVHAVAGDRAGRTRYQLLVDAIVEMLHNGRMAVTKAEQAPKLSEEFAALGILNVLSHRVRIGDVNCSGELLTELVEVVASTFVGVNEADSCTKRLLASSQS